MSRRAAMLLRVTVIWTVWVWAVLISNMISDAKDGWSFRLIHIGLAIVSLAFAVVTWYLTTKARRFTRAVERERKGSPDPLRTAHSLGAATAVMARHWRASRSSPRRPPASEAPDAQGSGAQWPGEAPGAQAPGAQAPGAQVPGAQAPGPVRQT